MEGKVAFITGGGSGIGRATALAFAEKKVKVAVVDLVNAQKTVDLIKQKGGTAIAIKADVSIAKDVENAIKTTVDQFGRIDFAFNNAGIEGDRACIHEYPEKVFDQVMNSNCKGVFLCMKYEIAQMLKQKADQIPFSIVNTTSTAAFGGMSEFSAYCASKHAIIGLTKTAALEYAKKNIRVNAVAPATTDTEMVERFTKRWPEWQKATNESIPVGRIGTPEEVARAVVWLCSGECTFITGTVLTIDGASSA